MLHDKLKPRARKKIGINIDHILRQDAFPFIYGVITQPVFFCRTLEKSILTPLKIQSFVETFETISLKVM